VGEGVGIAVGGAVGLIVGEVVFVQATHVILIIVYVSAAMLKPSVWNFCQLSLKGGRPSPKRPPLE